MSSPLYKDITYLFGDDPRHFWEIIKNLLRERLMRYIVFQQQYFILCGFISTVSKVAYVMTLSKKQKVFNS